MKRVQYQMEFIFRASPSVLYKFFSVSSRIVMWFCDEVEIANNKYTFVWEDSEEVAYLTESHEEEFLRFKWEDADDEDEYFEFRFEKSPVTGDTVLKITDFCDEDELDFQRELWDTQIQQLMRATGG